MSNVPRVGNTILKNTSGKKRSTKVVVERGHSLYCRQLLLKYLEKMFEDMTLWYARRIITRYLVMTWRAQPHGERSALTAVTIARSYEYC